MHAGSCLCGAITYTTDSDLGPITFCHCSRCQKANGSAFLAAAQIDSASFKVIDPDHHLKYFESSPGVQRHFCGNCGSPLFSRRPGPPEIIRLRIGTLDTPVTDRPAAHIFHADKACWFEMTDDVPKFDERPTN